MSSAKILTIWALENLDNAELKAVIEVENPVKFEDEDQAA